MESKTPDPVFLTSTVHIEFKFQGCFDQYEIFPGKEIFLIVPSVEKKYESGIGFSRFRGGLKIYIFIWGYLILTPKKNRTFHLHFMYFLGWEGAFEGGNRYFQAIFTILNYKYTTYTIKI